MYVYSDIASMLSFLTPVKSLSPTSLSFTVIRSWLFLISSEDCCYYFFGHILLWSNLEWWWQTLRYPQGLCGSLGEFGCDIMSFALPPGCLWAPNSCISIWMNIQTFFWTGPYTTVWIAKVRMTSCWIISLSSSVSGNQGYLPFQALLSRVNNLKTIHVLVQRNSTADVSLVGFGSGRWTRMLSTFSSLFSPLIKFNSFPSELEASWFHICLMVVSNAHSCPGAIEDV